MMAKPKSENNKSVVAFRDNYEHLESELRKLDLLIQKQALIFSLQSQAAQPEGETQGKYITYSEVDLMLDNSFHVNHDHSELKEIVLQIDMLQKEIDCRTAQSRKEGVFLALPQLAFLFSLSPFELQTIVICVAPELDRKYDKLYAYLQNDITRKKPGVDLVINLLCEERHNKWKARSEFTKHSNMFRADILTVVYDHQSPSGSSDLARFLKIDPRVLNYLLGNNAVDDRLTGFINLCTPLTSMDKVAVDSSIKEKLLNISKHNFVKEAGNRKKMVLHFYGPYGSGKKDLASAVCKQLDCEMLCLDMELLLSDERDAEHLLRLAFRESIFSGTAVFIDNVDLLYTNERSTVGFIK